ncbi:MAG TPA: type I-U CRISPR-associated helicase/endonuclease Cas3, partial [Phycisphaerae bacterium]|nr:type I-U CRISPR-associated helicase/endonuclease Cas3 [Phycisphaerae bacterium]
SPETAAAVREVLAQELADGVGLFTGTIRGYERDQLAESELFKAFRSDPHRPLQLEQTRYLVSTSAGEVGADLDADHLVCDLTTLDGTAQRFGRVNRLGVDAEGKPRTARITIVAQPPGDGDPLKVPLTKTKECLERLPKLPREPEDSGTGPVCDASPKALSEAFFDSDAPHRKDADEAISPPPRILPATDILFDSWALTSIMGELPGRPEVGPYLHGVAEWEPPETSVVWRAEIEELVKAGTTEDDLAEMLEAFPVRAVERAKDRVDRVQRELGLIAERHPDASAILIMNGEPRWATLAELAPADKNDKAKMNEARRMLAYATVILPTQVGGLKGGMLDGAAPAPEDHKTLDVAEVAVAGQRVRQRVRLAGDTETGLMGDAPAPGLPCRFALSVSAADTDDEDSPAPSIEYRVAKAESGEPGRAVLLSDHSAAVEAAAQRIGAALGLAEPFGTALALAAKTHDAGKARAVWQRYARNGQPGAQPLAKATRYLHAKALGGYRHEFGSLLDSARSADEAGLSVDEAGEVAEIANHPDRDLILHLVAAHHGWGRPHFEAKAFDRERPTSENEAVAVEVMQRFGRLQQRFGRWGLAWLESLFRCADAIGSQPEPSRDPEGAGSAGGAGVPPADSSSEHERAVAPDASHASAGDTCDGGHV